MLWYMATQKKTMRFDKNQKIVYPLQGVGVIRDIEQRSFDGKKLMYYVIYLAEDDMTLMVPVEKATTLGLRNIISKKQAEELLEKIGTEKVLENNSDWKQRYINNMEQLRDGTLLENTAVIRSLYLRSRVKDLPIMERKLYDSSFRALVEELSLALKQNAEEIKKVLKKKFESNTSQI